MVINSKSDYIKFINADREASCAYSGKSISSKLKDFLFPNYEWTFIKELRYLEYCENVLKGKSLYGNLRWLFAKLRFRRLSIKLGYSIPINVIGPGLSLPHRGNIIINPNTKIGSNCRIHVGVNIGAHLGKAPQIGDNVYIGPGAILFGDVKIANNITIGANATVNKSFLQENVVIAGTPAKVIKEYSDNWIVKSSYEK